MVKKRTAKPDAFGQKSGFGIKIINFIAGEDEYKRLVAEMAG
jgi:hypothetical protein